MYITSFMGFFSFGVDLIFLEETYPPQILVAKAAELRRRTGNHFIHAKQEEIEVDFRELMEKNLSRPMRLLFQEPIILLLSIYMSFIYGILYLFLTAYPLVFQGVHHFSAGVSGLTFFGMIIGELIAGLVVLAQQPWYQRKLAANNGIPIPEWRLPSVIAGGVAFSAVSSIHYTTALGPRRGGGYGAVKRAFACFPTFQATPVTPSGCQRCYGTANANAWW